MKLFDWDADLSDIDRDAMIEKMARTVERRGLEMPAILALEMHKPFSFLAGQAVLLGSGMLAPLFGPRNVQRFAKLLESRENVELLIRRLESPPKTDEHAVAETNSSERGHTV